MCKTCKLYVCWYFCFQLTEPLVSTHKHNVSNRQTDTNRQCLLGICIIDYRKGREVYNKYFTGYVSCSCIYNFKSQYFLRLQETWFFVQDLKIYHPMYAMVFLSLANWVDSAWLLTHKQNVGTRQTGRTFSSTCIVKLYKDSFNIQK